MDLDKLVTQKKRNLYLNEIHIGTKYVVYLWAGSSSSKPKNSFLPSLNDYVAFEVDYFLYEHDNPNSEYYAGRELTNDELTKIGADITGKPNKNHAAMCPKDIVIHNIKVLFADAGIPLEREKPAAISIQAPVGGGVCSVCGGFDSFANYHSKTGKLVCYRHCG